MKPLIHVTEEHMPHGAPGSLEDCAIACAVQESIEDARNPCECYDVVYFRDLEGRCYERTPADTEVKIRAAPLRPQYPARTKNVSAPVPPDHQKGLRPGHEPNPEDRNQQHANALRPD